MDKCTRMAPCGLCLLTLVPTPSAVYQRPAAHVLSGSPLSQTKTLHSQTDKNENKSVFPPYHPNTITNHVLYAITTY